MGGQRLIHTYYGRGVEGSSLCLATYTSHSCVGSGSNRSYSGESCAGAMASKRCATESHMAKKQDKLAKVRQGGVDLTYHIMLDELQCHRKEFPHKIPLVLCYAEKLDSDPGAKAQAKLPSGIPLSRTTLGAVAEGTLKRLLGLMCDKFNIWVPKVNKSKDKDLWLHLVCAATQSLPQDKITAAQHQDMHAFFAFYQRKFLRMHRRLLPDITLVHSHEQGFDWQKHGLYALVGMTSNGKVDFSCQQSTCVPRHTSRTSTKRSPAHGCTPM